LPLTDPNRRDEGFLLPIGGPKGYGLAMAIGLLAGTLNGAAFGSDVIDFTADTSSTANTGQFVAAISVSAFGDPQAFGDRVERSFDEMRASQSLPGHDPVRIPGEGREALREDRMAHGIPIHQNLVKELQSIAAELGIPPVA
jgi:LDH2 family malate/lactate/ureidoglycolate dehydrogenase